MNIRVESAGPCRRELHIEMPAERVRAAFDEVLGAYAKMARIPGFRPGRAPRDLVRRRFQKEITGEVKERLIPEGYQEAIQREKLETIAVLDVREQAMEEGQPFAFTVTLDVAPAFELAPYKGLKLTRLEAPLTDEDVEAVIRNIREQNGRYEDVSGRAVQQGDLVQIDYEGVCEGTPLETLAPQAKGVGKGTDFWMVADEANEFLPGFSTGLLGAGVGEQRQVLVDFPADFPEAALAGKKATYFAKVKALREKRLPEIDAEFLKSVGADSLDALKERVRRDLGQLRVQNENRRLQNEIIKTLLEKTQVDVPESVLHEETRQEVYDLVRQSQYRGVSKDEIENKKEEIFDAASRSAGDKVKVRYILRRIAKNEGLGITEAEIQARLVALSQSWGVPLDRLKADMEKRNAMGQVRDDVLLSKTLTWLLEQAEVTAGAKGPTTP